MIDSKMKAPAARAWLPDAALADGTIERRIAGMVEEWSAKWIANGALTLHGTLAPVAERGSADGAEWLVLDDQLAVSANGAARLALAGLMLAMRLTERSLSADDRPIVDRLAAAAVEDLCRRLANGFGFPPNVRLEAASALPAGLQTDALGCGLSAGPEEPPIHVVAALELVVALRRSCAATIPAPILLKPLAEGLARQPVTVSAMLGRASVTLSEFSQLSSGDVLLLDGDPSDTLELAIERRARSGSCTIEERAGSYQLKIVEPVVSVG